MFEKKEMKCPFCGNILKKDILRAYETGVEHVMDPNRDSVSLRESYICGCPPSNSAFWSYQGEYYLDIVDWMENRKKPKYTSAINSLARQIDIEVALAMKRHKPKTFWDKLCSLWR